MGTKTIKNIAAVFEDIPVQAISLEVKTVTERGDLRDELGLEFDATWIKVW